MDPFFPVIFNVSLDLQGFWCSQSPKKIFELDSILAEPICWIVFFFRAKDEFGDHPPLYNSLHEGILLGTCMYHQQAYRCFKHLNDEYFGRWNHHISVFFEQPFFQRVFSHFVKLIYIFHLLYIYRFNCRMAKLYFTYIPTCSSHSFDPAADRSLHRPAENLHLSPGRAVPSAAGSGAAWWGHGGAGIDSEDGPARLSHHYEYPLVN